MSHVIADRWRQEGLKSFSAARLIPSSKFRWNSILIMNFISIKWKKITSASVDVSAIYEKNNHLEKTKEWRRGRTWLVTLPLEADADDDPPLPTPPGPTPTPLLPPLLPAPPVLIPTRFEYIRHICRRKTFLSSPAFFPALGTSLLAAVHQFCSGQYSFNLISLI